MGERGERELTISHVHEDFVLVISLEFDVSVGSRKSHNKKKKKTQFFLNLGHLCKNSKFKI